MNTSNSSSEDSSLSSSSSNICSVCSMDCTSSEEEDEVLGRFNYKRRIYAESMANFLEEFNKEHVQG
ncbi:unnamed protein product, partial [Callosobruchus maculatus]